MTLAHLSEATEVPEQVLQAGVQSGLLAGWYRVTDGGLRFRPSTAEFVRWSARLTDAVLAGDVTIVEAQRLLYRRSRRQSFGLPVAR